MLSLRYALDHAACNGECLDDQRRSFYFRKHVHLVRIVLIFTHSEAHRRKGYVLCCIASVLSQVKAARGNVNLEDLESKGLLLNNELSALKPVSRGLLLR